MRLAGIVILALLWFLLLAAYSAPLWVSRFWNWDIWVGGHAAARSSAIVLLAIVLALPPIGLGVLTRWWLHRGRA